ncbi:MAG: hypothetical protein ABL898_17945, partial [Hyphomicrobiaceae bacterium]
AGASESRYGGDDAWSGRSRGDGGQASNGAGRVPGIEAFPPHAQREYRAYGAEGERDVGGSIGQHGQNPVTQKNSLFQRLTGSGRNKQAPTPSDVQPRRDMPGFLARGK